MSWRSFSYFLRLLIRTLFNQRIWSSHTFHSMYQQTFYGSTQGLSNHFMPTNSYFYRAGPIPAASNHHLNFTRDFDCFPSMPSGARPYYDAHKRWKAPFTRLHTNQTQAFHFQDKSTFYFMSEPIRTSDDRIVVRIVQRRKFTFRSKRNFVSDSINQSSHRAERRPTKSFRWTRIQ